MAKAKQGLFLIGYRETGKGGMAEVCRTKLAETAEEWADKVAKHQSFASWDPDCRSPEAEIFLSLPGVNTRGQAVRKLMQMHFNMAFPLVAQQTYWPGRACETWKGTTAYLEECYLSVERSDGQPF